MLISVCVSRLYDMAPLVNPATQTITHFGFSNDELKLLAQSLIGRGGFWLVPIGEALAFQPDWDGVPLLQHMTRIITWTN